MVEFQSADPTNRAVVRPWWLPFPIAPAFVAYCKVAIHVNAWVWFRQEGFI